MTVFIEKFKCMYHGGLVPVIGKIYLLNNHVCFASKLDANTLFGKSTDIKIPIEEIIRSELTNELLLGHSLDLFLTDKRKLHFSSFSNGLNTAHEIIMNMLESAHFKKEQKII